MGPSTAAAATCQTARGALVTQLRMARQVQARQPSAAAGRRGSISCSNGSCNSAVAPLPRACCLFTMTAVCWGARLYEHKGERLYDSARKRGGKGEGERLLHQGLSFASAKWQASKWMRLRAGGS